MIGAKANVEMTLGDLQAAARAGNFRSLYKYGGLLRRVAGRSIRPRKKASAGGRPPNSHAGTLRHGIFFQVERDIANVVIGAGFVRRHMATARKTGDGKPIGNTIPGVLEDGGDVQIVEYQRYFTPRGRHLVKNYWHRDPDEWIRLGRKKKFHKNTARLKIRNIRRRRIRITKRPFMTPAQEVANKSINKIWEASIKK